MSAGGSGSGLGPGLGSGSGAGTGVERARGVSTVAALASDIKIAHSVFALPFAVLGAFLAGPGRWVVGESAWWGFAGKLAIVVACMVCARTWAMLFNRIVDRRIDAANPRTAGRALASGRVGAGAAWLAAIGAAGMFVGCCGLFWVFFANPWPVYLSVPVLAWVAFYSLTKRFTWLCHVFLGGALAASPIASAIAVAPEAVRSLPSVWWLAGFVMMWVAGFDIVYALQDERFDRERGLSSVPARLGASGAMWVSRALHAAAMVMLLASWTSSPRLGEFFGIGVGVVAILLLAEHAITARIVKRIAAGGEPGGLKMTMAFFTLNGIVSCVLGVLGVVDVVMHLPR